MRSQKETNEIAERAEALHEAAYEARYAEADRIADANDEINGEHWEDWAGARANEDVARALGLTEEEVEHAMNHATCD